MRRFTAFLFLGAATGLILETSWSRADDNDSQPTRLGVEQSDAGETPAPGHGERSERGKREQRGRREGGPGGPGHHGPPPIIAALDTNDDGVISSTEIEGAVAALKTLDKNGDGELTMPELHPNHQGRGGEFGRHGGPRERGPGRRGPEDRGLEDNGPGGRGFGERGPRDRRFQDRGPGRREPEDRGFEHSGPGGHGFGGRGERPSLKNFVEMVMKADGDGDGKISKDEAPERLLRRFDRIDADGNGSIEKSELEEAAKRIGERLGRGRQGERDPGRGRKKSQRPPLDDTEGIGEKIERPARKGN